MFSQLACSKQYLDENGDFVDVSTDEATADDTAADASDDDSDSE